MRKQGSDSTGNPVSKLIGLMMGLSPNLLTGLLGILKSGNGFVPIDPDYPAERISLVLNECEISILVTESRFLERARLISQQNPVLQHIICIEEIDEADAQLLYCDDEASASLDNKSIGEAEQLAYVIYTSGSTGQPKGVPIRLANLMPLLLWSKDYFNLGEHTSVLQNLSFCFDFGIFELLTTLLFGGTLYFPDEDERGDPSRYAELIHRHSINTVHSTPLYFIEIIAAAGKFDTLKTVHLGGEQLTTNMVERIFERIGDDCILYNGYGPTEATVNCSIFRAGRRSEQTRLDSASIPIGKVSANNSLFVLDRDCEPVPIGIPGELYIGGDGLSQGYINRPELTAEKFIPNPYAKEPGSRLYKSGDMVRYLPDGNIEFLGRIDRQVKIRGFRIELGEIEYALCQHFGVKDALVLATEQGAGDKRLVAYIVPAQEEHTWPAPEALIDDVRRFIREKLTSYMIPTFFVLLDTIPLTPNGKVDLKALPAAEQSRDSSPSNYVAPRSHQEELLARMWAEILVVDRVAIDDNFFELGGQSLSGLQLVSRVRKIMQVELPLRCLFEAPTIAEFSRAIDKARSKTDSAPKPAIVAVARDRYRDKTSIPKAPTSSQGPRNEKTK
jgi:amino acid adenylation domain-containing protein